MLHLLSDRKCLPHVSISHNLVELIMKKTFKANKGPGKRATLCIEERSYKTKADRRRAMTILDRYWRKRGLATITIFTLGNDDDGNPRLYMARCWTREELASAGLTPEDVNYSNIMYNWRSQ